MADLPAVVVEHPHVVLGTGLHAGVPLIKGTMVHVLRLWQQHKYGVTCEVLWKHYPRLTRAQILDALSFAYDNPALIAADEAREDEMILRHAVNRPELSEKKK